MSLNLYNSLWLTVVCFTADEQSTDVTTVNGQPVCTTDDV